MAILVKRKKASIALLSICNAKHQSSLVPLTAEMATTLPCPRGNAHSRRRDNVTTGQGPLFQMAKPPRKGVQKSSELPRCVAGQTRRAAVAIVWQREKGFRAGTGTGDSIAGFVSSAPSPNDAMPHYFRNHEAVSLKLPQAARQVAPKTPSPTPLKGHGHPAAIKGWSPEHATNSAVWHGVGLLT